MTLHDISNGPMWITWVALALLVIMTIVLLSGKGSGLVAGFNTMSKEEQDQYDAKKLSRVVGYGFIIIDLMIFVMILGENVLPAWFAYVVVAVILLDVIGIILIGNFLCKK